jgi:hypothetical protein
MTRLSAFIATLFPVDEYVPGFGFISRLPGSLAPRQGKVHQQQPGNDHPELARPFPGRGSVVALHAERDATNSEQDNAA